MGISYRILGPGSADPNAIAVHRGVTYRVLEPRLPDTLDMETGCLVHGVDMIVHDTRDSEETWPEMVERVSKELAAEDSSDLSHESPPSGSDDVWRWAAARPSGDGLRHRREIYARLSWLAQNAKDAGFRLRGDRGDKLLGQAGE